MFLYPWGSVRLNWVLQVRCELGKTRPKAVQGGRFFFTKMGWRHGDFTQKNGDFTNPKGDWTSRDGAVNSTGVPDRPSIGRIFQWVPHLKKTPKKVESWHFSMLGLIESRFESSKEKPKSTPKSRNLGGWCYMFPNPCRIPRAALDVRKYASLPSIAGTIIYHVWL